MAGLKLRGTKNKSQLEEVTERSLRARISGKRSRIGSASPAAACQVASSNDYVSRVLSRCNQTFS